MDCQGYSEPVSTQVRHGHRSRGEVVSETDAKKISSLSLLPPGRKLKGPSGKPLPTKGKFLERIATGGCEVEQEVYVVSELSKPLLGRPAIEALHLLARVGAVRDERNPVERYPQLFTGFTGLGKLDREYTVQLRKGAISFALNMPCRVAIPLMQPVKEEHMEKLGLISPVEEPATAWCAGMVVVPKSDGRVRTCVDLTNVSSENVTSYQQWNRPWHRFLRVVSSLCSMLIWGFGKFNCLRIHPP